MHKFIIKYEQNSVLKNQKYESQTKMYNINTDSSFIFSCLLLLLIYNSFLHTNILMNVFFK